jgi:hypothetical protein
MPAYPSLAAADLDALVDWLDLDTKVRLLSGAGDWTTQAVPEIGLDGVTFSDGPVGVRGAGFAVRAPRRDEDAELRYAVELAGSSDVAVVVVGTDETGESEGFDRTSLALAIGPRALRHWEADQRIWAVEPGEVVLATGPSAGDLRVYASTSLRVAGVQT